MASAPSDHGAGGLPPHAAVLLLGFMASGKSTVGRRLAQRLGWAFVDFDDEVEARAGVSVARIFQEQGEEAFRALEGQVGAEALARDRVVLAAGGGWPTRPGRLDTIPPDTLTVWLKVDAETALERAASTPGVRPLLTGPHAAARAAELLRERLPYYARAHLHLEGAGTAPDALVDAIVAAMRHPHPAPPRT